MDVLRDMKIEPEKHLSWAVGIACRVAWENIHGALPEKALRPKTNDRGSHCFAIYPDRFRATIVTIVKAHVTEARRQGDLFG